MYTSHKNSDFQLTMIHKFACTDSLFIFQLVVFFSQILYKNCYLRPNIVKVIIKNNYIIFKLRLSL